MDLFSEKSPRMNPVTILSPRCRKVRLIRTCMFAFIYLINFYILQVTSLQSIMTIYFFKRDYKFMSVCQDDLHSIYILNVHVHMQLSAAYTCKCLFSWLPNNYFEQLSITTYKKGFYFLQTNQFNGGRESCAF